jgi:hypothetical protein
LADVAGLQGNTEQRLQLLRHAREVARAGGDVETVQEIETLLASSGKK